MPNYNHGHFLHRSLGAILAQSYQPSEFIIVDDASTDNSLEVIESFCRKKPSIRLIRNERNMGVNYVTHQILKEVSSDYVYFAGADDQTLPGFLEKSMSLLATHPRAGLCSTLSRIFDENGKDKGVLPSVVVSKKPRYFTPQECLAAMRKYGSWIKGTTTVYRLDALIDAGGFIQGLRSFSDGFIQMVIALKYGVCFVPEPLAAYRETPYTYSSSTMSDSRQARAIYEHAAKLMETTYRDLFPPDLVVEWKKRWLWFAGVYGWYSIYRLQEQYVKNVAAVLEPAPSWRNKIFRDLLRLLMNLQAAGVVFLWTVKFRSLIMWLVRRWFKRAKKRAYS